MAGGDNVVREMPEGHPLLDNDGQPLAEIDVDNVDDAMGDRGATLQQLAAGARAWRFGHVIVDEAQDLTAMQWRMIARRARGGSMTIVGDLAQRSIGTPGEWRDHLPDSIDAFEYQELTVNYRSPAEVSDLAARVLMALAPDLTPSTSIRSVGTNPTFVEVADLRAELESLVRRAHAELDFGRTAVIGAPTDQHVDIPGVQWHTPWNAKGLEFDSVVIVEPASIVAEPNGLSLLYVALTRTTNRLTIVHQQPLPAVLS